MSPCERHDRIAATVRFAGSQIAEWQHDGRIGPNFDYAAWWRAAVEAAQARESSEVAL